MKGLDLTAPFRQLMERRLWPLALLLLAGLAAVPLLLAKDGAEAPAPAGPISSAPAPAAGTQPVVSVSDAGALEERRKVLGAAKDPFRPVPVAPSNDADVASVATVEPPEGSGSAGSSGPSLPTPTAPSGGGAPAGLPSPPSPAPVVTEPSGATATYSMYALRVRFGDATADKQPATVLKRLQPMPSRKQTALVYLGLTKDRKSAVFLTDAATRVSGDGRCEPRPDDCNTVRLRMGETALVDVLDGEGDVVRQYRLRAVKVLQALTSDPRVAKAVKDAEARGGRKALDARLGRVGRWRYDAGRGTLKRISLQQLRAAAARASTR